MPPLIEADRRKPEFQGGVEIELADGQRWTFPRPVVDLCPTFSPGGEIDVTGRFDDAYFAKLEAFFASDGLDRLKALMALAVDLLRRNYDLAPAELQAILRYRSGCPESLARWQAIANVAQGTPDPNA